MKNRSVLTVLLLAIFITFSSCIEITEKLSVNRDGSGTYAMTIDMSEMKAMIDAMGGMDEDAESPLAELEKNYQPIMAELSGIEGISQVNIDTDEEAYVITTSFQFADEQALNRGMAVVLEDSTESGEEQQYYVLKKRSLIRTPEHDMLQQLKASMGEEMESQDMDLAQLFSDVTYVNSLEFPDRRIRRVNNDELTASEDGTAASIEKYIFREGEDLQMEYKIRLKRR